MVINKKNVNRIGVLIGFFLMASFAIAAAVDTGIGVSSPYWGPENPLKVYPGESAIVTMTLGSAPGASDTYFVAEITENGNGIATLNQPGLTYFVKGGTKVEVPILINVPTDAVLGTSSKVNIMFTEASPDKPSDRGSVQISGGVSNGFPVEIVTKEQSTQILVPTVAPPSVEGKGNNVLVWGIIILAIIILYMVFRKMKKN